MPYVHWPLSEQQVDCSEALETLENIGVTWPRAQGATPDFLKGKMTLSEQNFLAKTLPNWNF